MNRKAWLTSLFWSLWAGAAVALLNGERQAISLRIWLATFAIWFGAATLRRLTAEVPLLTVKLRPLFAAPGVTATPNRRLRELRNLEGLVLRSGTNERAFAQQLQPRLIALADHFLPVHHGIDRHRQPERAAELLGDVAWLVDDRVTDRKPTTDELNRFADRLIPSTRLGAEEAA